MSEEKPIKCKCDECISLGKYRWSMDIMTCCGCEQIYKERPGCLEKQNWSTERKGQRVSREIEFRGKRLDNSKWVHGNLVTMHGRDVDWTTGIQVKFYGAIEYGSVEVIPETVGQFAECKDDKRTEEYSKGQKIFDGDIVKWTSLNIDGEAVGEVTFFTGCWFIQGEKHNGPLEDCLTCEVIGNIHDNQRATK